MTLTHGLSGEDDRTGAFINLLVEVVSEDDLYYAQIQRQHPSLFGDICPLASDAIERMRMIS